MRTSNPALGDNTFTAVGRVARGDEAMTIQGTANKAILLLLCVLVTASWIWSMTPPGSNSLGGGGSHRRVRRGPGHDL